MSAVVNFVEINWAGRPVRIEYQWLAREKTMGAGR